MFQSGRQQNSQASLSSSLLSQLSSSAESRCSPALTLVGSRYAAATPVLTLAPTANNAKLVYQNLGLTKTLTVSKANLVTVTNPGVDKTSVKINATAGVFSGKYMDDAVSRTFAGAIMQKGPQPRDEGHYVKAETTDQILFSAP